jgi:3,4-dihydroxy-2-butanone 4-phosphate synthase
MSIASTTEIIEEIRAGRMVVLVDEEDRENEGDLVMAAEFATPEAINFMARYGRGLICLTLTEDRCRQLDLPLMVRDNRSPMGTNFTMSIEAAEGVTTGISAYDRAHTIRTAVKPDARAADLRQPGHIFPLTAQPGGVLARTGHTEAASDLPRLAGPHRLRQEAGRHPGELGSRRRGALCRPPRRDRGLDLAGLGATIALSAIESQQRTNRPASLAPHARRWASGEVRP